MDFTAFSDELCKIALRTTRKVRKGIRQGGARKTRSLRLGAGRRKVAHSSLALPLHGVYHPVEE
jgi:hypothetical protein